MRIDLIVIDGQNDFVDPNGALYVAGAEKEAVNLANMIKRLKKNSGHVFSKIHATLDAHHLNDIAHPTMWIDEDGNHPSPFTIISKQDVVDGKWRASNFGKVAIAGQEKSFNEIFTEYVTKLEEFGRNMLCIWPPHCLIGTPGQAVYPELFEAYTEWCKTTQGWINFVAKGTFQFSEHYSAIRADVPNSAVPGTQMNTALLDDVNKADKVVWAGWAGSHCTKWTVKDAIDYFGEGENSFIRKSILLEDATAPVGDIPGVTNFAQDRLDFIDEFKSRGGTVTTTQEFMAV